MYRQKDIVDIDKNINKIKDEAIYEYKKQNEPTLDESSQVCKVIIDFIKRKKRVVYGGYAQNLLIINKNKKDGFYKEINGAFYNWPDLADIEFYTPYPIDDLIELTEELYSHKFNNIESIEGMHNGTYKIYVNFLNYCDISYIPTHIYNTMPIITAHDIKCTHPHMMMVDAFRIFTDPLTSFWRLDKTILRFQKIFKYYPIDESNNNLKIKLSENKDINDFICQKIIHNSKLIVVGFHGFDYYVKKSIPKNALNNYPYYELISIDLEEDAMDIYKILKDKFKTKITVKEFSPFFTFMDRRVEFYHENKLCLRLFGSNKRCIVYNYSDIKTTTFGTNNLVMMYLYFDYYLAYINKDSINTKLYLNLIGKFYNAKNKFLNSNNKSIVDESPFKDFTCKCYGTQIDPIRLSKLEELNKRKQNKMVKYRYNPTGKAGATPDYKFDNISGNEILIKNHLIIKNH